MPELEKVSITSLNSLKSSILVSIDNPSANKITLEIKSQGADDHDHYDLKISNVIKVYYQRFEASIQREGFRNLNRVKLSNDNTEWISKFTTWQSAFTDEIGFELSLYNGSILRFVGDSIILEKKILEDIHNKQNYRDIPDHIEQTDAKIILGTNFGNKKISDQLLKNNQEEPAFLTDPSQEINIDERNGEAKIFSIQTELTDQIDQTEEIIQLNEIKDYEEDLGDLDLSTEADFKEESNTINIADTIIKDDEGQIAIPSEDTGMKTDDLLKQIIDSRIEENTDTTSSIEEVKDRKSKESNILKVNGVTSQNMESLISIGCDSIEKLATMNISQLIKINGIGKATARKIIQSSKLLISSDI